MRKERKTLVLVAMLFSFFTILSIEVSGIPLVGGEALKPQFNPFLRIVLYLIGFSAIAVLWIVPIAIFKYFMTWRKMFLLLSFNALLTVGLLALEYQPLRLTSFYNVYAKLLLALIVLLVFYDVYRGRREEMEKATAERT